MPYGPALIPRRTIGIAGEFHTPIWLLVALWTIARACASTGAGTVLPCRPAGRVFAKRGPKSGRIGTGNCRSAQYEQCWKFAYSLATPYFSQVQDERAVTPTVRSLVQPLGIAGAIGSRGTSVLFAKSRSGISYVISGSTLTEAPSRGTDQNPPPPPGQRRWALREGGTRRVVEPWVWMSRNEVFSFAGFLSGSLTAANHPEHAAEALSQAVRAATGDVLGEQESIAAFMRRVFLLPFRNDTILRYTADQLQKKLIDQVIFQEDFEKEIGRSLERLSLAMAEQNADIELTWDPGRRRWIKPPVDQISIEKRWVSSEGSQEYGWFPLRYFPGGLQ